MLAAVHQPRQHLVEVVHLLLVEGNQAVEILGAEGGLLGLGHPEKFGVVGRHVLHVVLEAVQHFGFLLVDIAEKTGLVVVDLHRSGGFDLELLGCRDQRLGALFVEVAFRGHAAQDAAAAHGDVAVLVGEQDRGADALVAAAGRVGAVDAGQNGDAHLFQFGVAERRWCRRRAGRRKIFPARSA